MTPLPPAGWFPDPERADRVAVVGRIRGGRRPGSGTAGGLRPGRVRAHARRAGRDVEEHRQMAAVGDGRECRRAVPRSSVGIAIVFHGGVHFDHTDPDGTVHFSHAVVAAQLISAPYTLVGWAYSRLVHRVALQRREVRRFAALARGSRPHARCVQPVDPDRELLVAVRSDPRSLPAGPAPRRRAPLVAQLRARAVRRDRLGGRRHALRAERGDGDRGADRRRSAHGAGRARLEAGRRSRRDATRHAPPAG